MTSGRSANEVTHVMAVVTCAEVGEGVAMTSWVRAAVGRYQADDT